MKSKVPVLLAVLLFVTGAGLLCYPSIANLLSEQTQAEIIADYTKSMDQSSTEELESARSEAEAYNQRLTQAGPQIFYDAFAANEAPVDTQYLELMNLNQDGVMGSIEIPKINVYLPVYHGITDEVLEKGSGHMQGTSLPVGGVGTHCVIAGHRGLPSAELFTDLDQMVPGDLFYLHMIGEVLAYQIDQIQTVLPDQADALEIVADEDLVTLVTCTPYGINSHRLLIRGRRVPYEKPEQGRVSKPLQSIGQWLLAHPVFLVSIGIVLLIVIGQIIKKGRRKKI